MGYFKDITFNNYRNFTKSNFEFQQGCNIVIGKNGSGKTNILEGISLVERGRGFRKDKIINLINFNNKNKPFIINSSFKDNNIDYDIKIKNSENNFKEILLNGNKDTNSYKHFESLFSIMYFLPEMERLFVSSPSTRRNFVDRLIFTYIKNYNLIINQYRKAINERQVLLKNNSFDENWMQQIEISISKLGSTIYEKRVKFIKNLNFYLQDLNILKNFKNKFLLTIEDEFINSIKNFSIDDDQYMSKLKESRRNDFFTGGCSFGPHRSDFFGFRIEDNFNINQFSTGQQKTTILLIIIAQCKFLIDELKLQPIILLDEVCSHLDNINRDLLLYLTDNLGAQVFMTGTEKNLFSFLSTKANYCNIT